MRNFTASPASIISTPQRDWRYRPQVRLVRRWLMNVDQSPAHSHICLTHSDERMGVGREVANRAVGGAKSSG